jgi:superfamily II DNA or RNA helicase
VDDAPDGHWLGSLERHDLRRLLGARSLAIALGSPLRYATLPARRGLDVVAAVTDDDAATSETFEVSLRVEPDGALAFTCSRCATLFGPCVHVGVVAVDLACSTTMREALLAGESTRATADGAPSRRRALHLELQFDGALGAWVAPAAQPVALELAAGPVAGAEVPVGRAYGERREGTDVATVQILARARGDRRLLSGREIAELCATPGKLLARDRRVLEHARDRGNKKAVFAAGVEASLAIDAMRAHGTVLTTGYKTILRFRAMAVHPVVRLGNDAPDLPRGWGALSAFWVTVDGDSSIPFADATLFPGPFPYVWTKLGSLHPVAAEVDVDYARQLARAPILFVPPGRLADAGTQLLRATRGRGISVPSHAVFGLPPLEAPRVVLRLEGEPLAVTGSLTAHYRGRSVSLLPADTIAPEERRDLDMEARAVAAVGQAGAIEETVFAVGERAIAFWRDGLPALRAAHDPRIEVELTPRLAGVRVGAPLTGRVHVVLEGDWLKTRLDFAAGDLPVELDRVRAALQNKQRWVELDDGTLSRIDAQLEHLVDEAGAVMGEEAEALLPFHQLGRLERWIDANDGRVDASIAALRRRLRALAVAAEPDMPRGLTGTLRPYQRHGLAWLQFVEELGAGGILADDMGLGKTITTLAFLLRQKETRGPAPALVVCPTSVATNWLREAARFTPDLSVALFHGPSRDVAALAGVDVAVTTYAILRGDIDALAKVPFRTVVLDEAQNIKNPESATTRAATKLSAKVRLALSGTPMENRLRELWSLASFANPGILGTPRVFETRYERPLTTDRAAPIAAELRAIVRPFLLRRTKADVLTELPPKTEIDRIVTLTTADKRMYDALAHTLRDGLTQDIQARGLRAASLSVFTALTRLRQMACDPRLVDPSLVAAESAKREAFLDLVRELVAEGRRALVFSQFVQLLTLWRRDLDREEIPYVYLDGATTKRDEVVRRFQEGTAPLFLISLKAGGAGLNLTAADTVIHCDPWWNPAVEDQATDRAYRIGQDKPVTVVRLVARGTIEEKIGALKAKKRELVGTFIGADNGALDGITEDDIRALLGDADADALAFEAASATEDKTDTWATMSEIKDDEFHALVKDATKWMREVGRFESALADKLDLPEAFAARLAQGKPFPCSRGLGERLRARLRTA